MNLYLFFFKSITQEMIKFTGKANLAKNLYFSYTITNSKIYWILYKFVDEAYLNLALSGGDIPVKSALTYHAHYNYCYFTL